MQISFPPICGESNTRSNKNAVRSKPYYFGRNSVKARRENQRSDLAVTVSTALIH